MSFTEYETECESLLNTDLPQPNDEPCVPLPWETGRNYELERDNYDFLQLYVSCVSDPDHVNDTFEYFKSRKTTDLVSFLAEFNIENLKKRNLNTLLKEYDENCNLIEENRNRFYQLKKEVDNGKVLKGKEKKLFNGYLRMRFLVQRVYYYNDYFLEGLYDMRKVEY